MNQIHFTLISKFQLLLIPNFQLSNNFHSHIESFDFLNKKTRIIFEQNLKIPASVMSHCEDDCLLRTVMLHTFLFLSFLWTYKQYRFRKCPEVFFVYYGRTLNGKKDYIPICKCEICTTWIPSDNVYSLVLKKSYRDKHCRKKFKWQKVLP